MTPHEFRGQWITDEEFAALPVRNVFHRQLEKVALPCDEHRDRHILFRRSFALDKAPRKALLYITADDYYKVYVNGVFAGQGPAPSYCHRYNYNTLDVTALLRPGRNVLAVHTLYQGLINRVWVSGDNRHGLLCDLEADGRTVLQSDESFLTHPHTGFTEVGTAGYDTQFLEQYDSRAPEVGFAAPDFDDSSWKNALLRQNADCTTVPQASGMLEFEVIRPVRCEQRGSTLFVDFGSCYVGYLQAAAQGAAGSCITIRCGQELNEDGSVRWQLRANCNYSEPWLLSGGRDTLDWFDYKAFRYAELDLPQGAVAEDISLLARHYPFMLAAKMKPEYAADEPLCRIWELCVRSQKYGVQEVIQDCMEREKGFYVGDGCYTALAHMVLTGDDSMVRKLINDAFASTFITPGMVTCLDCAFMQEIAEYPLYLISLILWHYRLTGDRAYLAQNYPGVTALLDSYRTAYEKDGLLRDLDKWCVVEWPMNFRDGYDVDITEGQICHEPHVALNAFYLEALRCANTMAQTLGLPPYRDMQPLLDAFYAAFYDEERHLFTDSLHSDHVSFIGNVYPFAFRLYPDDACRDAILEMIGRRGITAVSMFGSFPLLYGLIRCGRSDLVVRALKDEGAWLRILKEGGTTTFEGWGKDTKWNTSLFHLTLSDAAIFLADIDHTALFA